MKACTTAEGLLITADTEIGRTNLEQSHVKIRALQLRENKVTAAKDL